MAPAVEEPTYYEQWGPVSRRIRKTFDGIRGIFTSKKVVLLESKWRLGDEIMMLPLYDAIHGKNAEVAVWCNYPELLRDNPHVVSVNEPFVRPHRYAKLRGAPRDVNRMEHYRKQLGITGAIPRPKLHFNDFTCELMNEFPKADGPVVALCRGASWETKRWPEAKWLELGQALECAGCSIIVLGQDGESLDVGTDFCGRTGVREAACLLHHADLTISNDSGLMHLSLAADTATIGLFGPTDPRILIREDERFHPLTNGRECDGCWNNNMTINEPTTCPMGIKVCMDVIEVNRVLECALGILGEQLGGNHG